MQITRKSIISGVTRTKDIDVTMEQLEAYYQNGLLAQEAFPGLDENDREFIMTGIDKEEWEDLTEEE